MLHTKHRSSLHFSLRTPLGSPFVPRIGTLTLHRHDEGTMLDIPTPGFIVSTSRGLVPHLSRDHAHQTDAIRWAHVVFESFLEHIPPIPIQQPGPHPLHKFLGFLPRKHIVSMTLRDPFDDREMPPNGSNFVSANCTRGVRQVAPADWRKYVLACDPDVVVALPDIPFTSIGHSQRRVTKSIERSALWLADLLQPLTSSDTAQTPDSPRLNVFLHMAGGTVPAARKAFSNSLLETLSDKEAEAVHPFKSLDEGVCGYTFDLVPLHKALSTQAQSTENTPLPATPPLVHATAAALDPTPNLPSSEATSQIADLLRASLAPLPLSKPRLANSAGSPHEMLILIRDVGLDLFDAHWAQRAGDIGIALDFTFPVRPVDASPPKSLGHNLYDTRYAHDFSPFANAFAGVNRTADDTHPICPCIACSPVPPAPSSIIRHSKFDPDPPQHPLAPYTRAYIHHLLHTHEMSAHTFLVAHNLCVLDAFFAGIRKVLEERPQEFEGEVKRFLEGYDEKMRVFGEAKKAWAEVELARGKGRLSREKGKQVDDTLGTAVEL